MPAVLSLIYEEANDPALSIKVYTERLCQKRLPFSSFWYLKGKRNLLFPVCKKTQKGYQMHFMFVKKLRKRSGFVILKGMRSFKVRIGKGYHLSIEGVRKRYLFSRKWPIKGKGLDFISTNICWVSPTPPPPPPYEVNKEKTLTLSFCHCEVDCWSFQHFGNSKTYVHETL